PWPRPIKEPIPWVPDAIVMLGGADLKRISEATRLAIEFPDIPIIISGDEGYLAEGLRRNHINPSRFLIEPDAESTWENASFLAPLFKQRNLERVILVTNWFHAPRSGAVFRKQYPEMKFILAFEPASNPVTPWDRRSNWREKLAVIYYLARYGVWSF
ncbi:MAG: YdcF family protein, partial [Verrucomicrobiales bacterium]